MAPPVRRGVDATATGVDATATGAEVDAAAAADPADTPLIGVVVGAPATCGRGHGACGRMPVESSHSRRWVRYVSRVAKCSPHSRHFQRRASARHRMGRLMRTERLGLMHRMWLMRTGRLGLRRRMRLRVKVRHGSGRGGATLIRARMCVSVSSSTCPHHHRLSLRRSGIAFF